VRPADHTPRLHVAINGLEGHLRHRGHLDPTPIWKLPPGIEIPSIPRAIALHAVARSARLKLSAARSGRSAGGRFCREGYKELNVKDCGIRAEKQDSLNTFGPPVRDHTTRYYRMGATSRKAPRRRTFRARTDSGPTTLAMAIIGVKIFYGFSNRYGLL